MKIYKHANGWYIAQVVLQGRIYTGTGRTHFEAIRDCIDLARPLYEDIQKEAHNVERIATFLSGL